MTSSKKKLREIKDLWNQNVWAFSQPVNKNWNVNVTPIASKKSNAANPAAFLTIIYVFLKALKKSKLPAVAAVAADAAVVAVAAVAAITVSITWKYAAQIVVMPISDVVTAIDLKKKIYEMM